MGTLNSINKQRSQVSSRLQAYLNLMCFNEQFKYDGQGGACGDIYIFVSNESNLPVFKTARTLQQVRKQGGGSDL